MILFDIVLEPAADEIPLISPNVPVLVLVVPLVRFEIVLPFMVMTPVPPLYIPNTLWAAPVLAELELILFKVLVLPIRLLLIVVVPAEALLLIPKTSVSLAGLFAAVMEPMLLFRQSTVPVLVIYMP